MSNVIIYETETGGVAIVVPAPDAGLTMDEHIAIAVPPGAVHRVVDRDVLPTDRSARNEWTYAGIVATL